MTRPFKKITVPDDPFLAKETYYPLKELNKEEGGRGKHHFVFVSENQEVSCLEEKRNSLPTIQGRMEAVLDGMKGCLALHQHGKIHRDIKPSNILCIKDDELDCLNWVLGDCEFLVDQGTSPTSEKDSLAWAGTPGYMDTHYYHQLVNELYKYVPGVDVFAFGVVMMSMYFDTDGKALEMILRNMFQKVDLDATPEEIAIFLKELFLEFKPKFPVPDKIRFQLAKMLMYMPEERCSLKEVIETLEDEYEMV